jgi:hypothetical protein
VIISLKLYYTVDLCDVSGSHSGDYEDDSRLWHSAMWPHWCFINVYIIRAINMATCENQVPCFAWLGPTPFSHGLHCSLSFSLDHHPFPIGLAKKDSTLSDHFWYLLQIFCPDDGGMSVYFNGTIQRYIPEGCNLQRS